MSLKAERNGPGEEDDHGGTNCCGQIGVDSGDADFRQQCGCSREYGRQDCPKDPGHAFEDTLTGTVDFVIELITPPPPSVGYLGRILLILLSLRVGVGCKIFHLKGLPAKYYE